VDDDGASSDAGAVPAVLVVADLVSWTRPPGPVILILNVSGSPSVAVSMTL
jgi:hypothetical protein